MQGHLDGLAREARINADRCAEMADRYREAGEFPDNSTRQKVREDLIEQVSRLHGFLEQNAE